MSELQTFLALVVLIYVLCVIVQAVQEILKWLLSMKAKTMAAVIQNFMGQNLLTVGQLGTALSNRGLDITALEHYNKDNFRSLLNGIQFTAEQVPEIQKLLGVQNGPAGPAAVNQLVEQFKDHAAAAYDAAMAKFQLSYTKNNKKWVIGLSFAVVLALNASVIHIYEVLAVNQTMSQAIAGTAMTIAGNNQSGQSGGTTQVQDSAKIFSANRDVIEKDLKQYPILFRTGKYGDLTWKELPWEILGLVLMGALVSLGAPFWNDVLKGINGVNSALNTGGKKTT